tara:strand:- start:609 stop:776 length:168 start_codon:yes stop_codon:yes gene_type:complete
MPHPCLSPHLPLHLQLILILIRVLAPQDQLKHLVRKLRKQLAATSETADEADTAL